ncbi:peptide MFS transporter [Dyella nitratireducens]|uniref:POT-family proton dependent transporter n=1 Tax=Dyella nitratireducens TaxID=1849580 RepID=A0ABQ1FKE8_9GAMM|nr:oligopeptide:H+ symporter [Dyella nitratireducens]GGA19661.1 POT-family proton dependent transporter [Dyella nitratireducens]GLQ44480.1 POT-family proton dependent transporter [Dyella nitratireducens]
MDVTTCSQELAQAHSPTRTRSAFVAVVMIEMWERFGYYGTASLLVLFMVQRLGLSEAQVNLIWGAFSVMIFAMLVIGGWIGDKVLGAKRCLLLGAVTLALGYLLLCLSGDRLSYVFTALSVIIVGNALFKPNAANLVRRIYEGSNAHFDSAFTLYYMGSNFAAAAAVLLTPWVKDRWGWYVAFALCCAGLLVSLIHYAVMLRKLDGVGSLPDSRPLPKHRFVLVLAGMVVTLFGAIYLLRHSNMGVDCVYTGGVIVVGIFVHMILRGSRQERAGLMAALILLVEASLFFIFYQQLATSLTLFALRNVDGNQMLFGHHLFTWSPAQYPAMNAVWILALSPMLAWLYRRLGQRDLPVAAKFAIGFGSVAAGFFSFGLSGMVAVHGMVPSWIMLLGYGFYSLGELLVAALGLAMISRYVPARMGGFMIGAFFVAGGVAQYLGAMIANLASLPSQVKNPLLSLPIYTHLFDQLGLLALAGAVIALALLPFINRLSSTHEACREGLASTDSQVVAATQASML